MQEQEGVTWLWVVSHTYQLARRDREASGATIQSHVQRPCVAEDGDKCHSRLRSITSCPYSCSGSALSLCPLRQTRGQETRGEGKSVRNALKTVLYEICVRRGKGLGRQVACILRRRSLWQASRKMCSWVQLIPIVTSEICEGERGAAQVGVHRVCPEDSGGGALWNEDARREDQQFLGLFGLSTTERM
ncbi:hypothetical protein BD309DRAFT_71444 [Dichomitus squalens]|nr:hypothetical protein BD309DRAFT_71444 [Dichomitus squalens]